MAWRHEARPGQLGTSDIATIVRKYNSRSFGFASRNFYLAFLAALEIDQNPEKFFPGIRRNAVDSSLVLKLPQPVPASRISTALDVDREELRRLNPALLNACLEAARATCRRVISSACRSHIDLSTVMAKLNVGGATEAVEVALAESQHRVEGGETLSVIASRYGVSQQQLAELTI